MRSFRRCDIVPYPLVFFRYAPAPLVRYIHVLRCMFLGLDLGTSSVKAALIDANGDVAAVTHHHYAVERSHAGWAETDPEQWWRATVRAVQQLDEAQRHRVRAVGFSGQMHGAVLSDARARALRPAILWLDLRASSELARFPPETSTVCGNRPSAGMAAASLLWLQRHEPDVYRDARWALQPKDWLRFRMGGNVATDPSDASATLLADIDGAWSKQHIEALGLRADWLPQVKPAHARAGELDKAAAQALGLRDGIALAVGAGDTPAAALGSGLLHDGEAQLTTGTGGQIVVMRARRPAYEASLNTFRSAAPQPFAPWYVMAAMLNVGSALEWARAMLGLDWDAAYAAAAQEQSGSIVFLPYLAGERTPLMDAQARGTWLGLTGATTKAMMMRAAFEGVAFTLRAGFAALQGAGHRPSTLGLAGGGSLHPWWRQLLADALGTALSFAPASAAAHASARGAALLAGLASDHWRPADLPQLSLPPSSTIEPRSDTALEQRYALHVRASSLMQELNKNLSTINE